MFWKSAESSRTVCCKPGEAYTRLKTHPGDNAHVFTGNLCMEFTNSWECWLMRLWYSISIFDISKCYLYIDPMKYLNLSCQGSNHHPCNSSWFDSNIKSVFNKNWTHSLLVTRYSITIFTTICWLYSKMAKLKNLEKIN